MLDVLLRMLLGSLQCMLVLDTVLDRDAYKSMPSALQGRETFTRHLIVVIGSGS